MSTLSKLSAWQIVGAHALRSATGPEDELVALEAMAAVASHLGLESEAHQVAQHCADLRRVQATRRELRDYFDGQLALNLGGSQA